MNNITKSRQRQESLESRSSSTTENMKKMNLSNYLPAMVVGGGLAVAAMMGVQAFKKAL